MRNNPTMTEQEVCSQILFEHQKEAFTFINEETELELKEYKAFLAPEDEAVEKTNPSTAVWD